MTLVMSDYDPGLKQGAVLPGSAFAGLSGDLAINSSSVVTIASGAITRSKMSSAAGSKFVMIGGGTIATTSTSITTSLAPAAGTITEIIFSGNDALAANDSNYLTWTITNLGQAGAGTTVILAATDANTTKATGGSAVSAHTKRTFTLTSTAADLVVAAGDRIRVTATATGTLANTITGPLYGITFAGTT